MARSLFEAIAPLMSGQNLNIDVIALKNNLKSCEPRQSPLDISATPARAWRFFVVALARNNVIGAALVARGEYSGIDLS